ncbi:unnamed protein product [Linum tenue]|uniref:NAC domain-containing protein n=1 Tax=Linum tenue TaxID=586396 RepID=A0AAV0M717_9ROSI|nr:unnamed protein product [Linum tenue]
MRESSAGGGGDPVNLSVNGQSQVPPGFRFHPTEEELLHYYLRKKVASDRIDLDVIREVDLNKLEPWDIQERCKIGSTPQSDWYFFSHKDKKYPTGTRTNRATAAGFWKATGRDKIIYSSYKRIGLRKTLVFYKGRAPHGQKSDWIMHEYRLDDAASTDTTTTAFIISSPGLNHVGGNYIIGGGDQGGSEEGWVVCRVFRKKNYQKSLESPRSGSSSANNNNNNLHHHASHIIMTPPPARCGGDDDNGVLDQILTYMSKQQQQHDCKAENSFANNTRFMHLPRLVADYENQQQHYHQQSFGDVTTENNNNNNNVNNNNNNNEASCCTNHGTGFDATGSGHDNKHGRVMMMSSQQQVVNDWTALDRLVASQLNGHLHDEVDLLNDGDDDDFIDGGDDDGGRIGHHHGVGSGMHVDLWSNFGKSETSPSSSSDPLCHLSV